MNTLLCIKDEKAARWMAWAYRDRGRIGAAMATGLQRRSGAISRSLQLFTQWRCCFLLLRTDVARTMTVLGEFRRLQA
jgi:hypothetical protein